MPTQKVFSRLCRLTAFCLPLLCAAWLATPLAIAESDKLELKLIQHEDHRGDLEIHITHDAVKAVSLNWGYIMVCKAPDWQIICYRPKEKLLWQGELEHFAGSMIDSPFEAGEAFKEAIAPAGTGILKGLKYTRFERPHQPLFAVYGLDEWPVAPQIAAFLSRLWETQDMGKVPIYRSTYRTARNMHLNSWIAADVGKDARTGLVIDLTTRSWAKLPYKAADFAVPTGCKRLNKLCDVGLSKSQKTNVEDLLGTFSASGHEAPATKTCPQKAPHQ